MSKKQNDLISSLEKEFIRSRPYDAATAIIENPIEKSIKLFESYEIKDITSLLDHLPINFTADICERLPAKRAIALLQSIETAKAASIYASLNDDIQSKLVAAGPKAFITLLNESINYPHDTAGAMMDRRILPFQESMTVQEAIHQLKKISEKKFRVIFIVDDLGKLIKYVHVQDLLFADKNTLLRDMAKNLKAYVRDVDSRDSVLESLEKNRLSDLPIVDYDGRFIGVIRYKTLLKSAREDMISDLATMVGASKEERALSKVSMVVKKRLPWLQINLITAFIAASVVGAFEDIIAKFTALAVLLPVVAGQSGNTGAQSLAVTIRGLVLREIHTSQWYSVMYKELKAGFVNGVAIAFTTSAGVFVWSRSLGLCLIIFISMILSMVIAGVAGAATPIILTKSGLDPAQSSSIILTTVTDVFGFFSFLGVASMLMFML